MVWALGPQAFTLWQEYKQFKEVVRKVGKKWVKYPELKVFCGYRLVSSDFR